MELTRAMKHLFVPAWFARRPFSRALLDRIEAAVRSSETLHDGELRFALEGGLHVVALLRGETPRERAIEVFSQLRVWDTAHNSGVLIYIQLVDHAIEIVADRGINAQVAQAEWDAICRRMEEAFRQNRVERGALAAIDAITVLLARQFPPLANNPDELPDRPVVL
jgi:uncharacterized membrane protein